MFVREINIYTSSAVFRLPTAIFNDATKLGDGKSRATHKPSLKTQPLDSSKNRLVSTASVDLVLNAKRVQSHRHSSQDARDTRFDTAER